ncbi:MAG TPA: hypothetical protein VFQ61_02040, partial [Polyangiaceae bacterium]|nr:hypothetical protein [Polyangiaceae bacterium]
MIPSRWEFGSDFHSLPPGECCVRLRPAAPVKAALRSQPVAPETTRASLPAEAHPHTFWASGRDALVALLQWAKPTLSLNRLWCPSYLCQPMLHAAKAADLSLVAYPDSPLSSRAETSRLELRSGDMVLAVGYFGLRGPALRLPPRRSASIYVLEDHSHDPWSNWAAASKADFCFASLRKTLPIPDGAVLWSPRGWVGPS